MSDSSVGNPRGHLVRARARNDERREPGAIPSVTRGIPPASAIAAREEEQGAGALGRTYRRSSPGISGADVNLPGDFSVSRNRAARLPAGQCAERERRRLQMRGLPAPQVPTGSTAGAGQVFWDPG